jgi:CDP-glycerol glycerophosphotransferase (TagB/SpsB family)
VYDLIPVSDCIVVTYSSVGMEALTRGYPVICLQLPSLINTSPLLDHPSPIFKVARNPEEFSRLLERSLSEWGSLSDEASVLGKRFFYMVGLRAEEEWARIIKRELSTPT